MYTPTNSNLSAEMNEKKLLNHRPESAVAGLDEADIEVERTAQVSLGQHIIAGAVGQDIALAQNHATVKGGQNIFNALGNEDDGELRVGGGELIYGIEQELSPGDIKVNAGFIENHELGVGHEGAGYQHFYLLPAAHGVYLAVHQVRGTQGFHECRGARLFLCRGIAEQADGGIRPGEYHLSPRPLAVAQPLVHQRAYPGNALAQLLQVDGAEAVAQHLYRSAEHGPGIAHEHAHQCCFARTVGTENKATLPALHLPVDMVKDFSAGKEDLGILDVDCVHEVKNRLCIDSKAAPTGR